MGFTPDAMIFDALRAAAQPLCSTDADIVMREKYETAYSLYNHEAPDPEHPLAIIRMHPGEDASTGSLLYERIEQFEERKIYQRFGLTLKDFLDLPSDVCMKVMEVAGKRLKDEGTIAASVMTQLNNLEGRR